MEENISQETPMITIERCNTLDETDSTTIWTNNKETEQTDEPVRVEASASDNDDSSDLPIDRGWAWMVLAGATLYLFIFGGVKKNFGIFFVAFQTRFNSTASLTSLLTTTQALTSSFTSLFVMTIGMARMSQRTAIMAGAVILTVGNLLTAFSTDIRVLFFSFGIMEGLAASLIHPPVTTILAEYFCKRRALANGLAFSGASFGGLTFAPIMTALFEYYGFSGTLMIVSGIVFHILISGAIMRPINSFKRRHRTPRTAEQYPEDTKLCQSENNPKINDTELSVDSLECPSRQFVAVHDSSYFETQTRTADLPNGCKTLPEFKRSVSCHDDKTSIKVRGISPLLRRQRTFSEGAQRKENSKLSSDAINQRSLRAIVKVISRSNVAIFASTDVGFCGSVVDISTERSRKLDNTNAKTLSPLSCWSATKVVIGTNLKILFDMSLIKNPVFLMIMLIASLSAPAAVFLSVCLVPHGKDVGLTSNKAAVLMSIVGGVGMFSRITMALIVDRKFVRLTTLLGEAFLFVGIVAHCVRFFSDFASLTAFAVVIGLCCEMYHALYGVLLVEYLSLAKMKSAMGFTALCQGISSSIIFPVVGYLRDATGSYTAPYHLLGGLSMLVGILFLLLPSMQKRIHAKIEKEQQFT